MGGINPSAVELSLLMGGRIVWFPTIAAQANIDYHATHHNSAFPTSAIPLTPEVAVEVTDEAGEPTPAVRRVIDIIKEADAILASGHLNPRQIDLVFAAAADAGVTKLLVNHTEFVVDMGYEQAIRLALGGAFIEHEAGMYIERATARPRPIAELLGWISAVGPERTTIGSDAGQASNPRPRDAYRSLCQMLLDNGVSEDDLSLMIRANPGRLLGVN